MTDFTDMTLDELRLALAPEVASSAIFDGWSDMAVVAAAEMTGVDGDVAKLAYPGGAMDMISAWIESVDAQMAAAFPQERIETMKIRERIRELVAFRLQAIEGQEEALRRARSIMAMPQNARSAILSGIYAATLAVFVDDESYGKEKTYAFLNRRIDGVMKFEKAKAKWLGGANSEPREHFSMSRFLGRLRYPGT